MSDFAGIVRTDDSLVPDAAAARLARSFDGKAKPRIWRPNPSVILVERRGPAGYDNGWASPATQLDSDRFIMATARLDAPRAVKDALGLDGPRLPDDRALVAAATLRWGPTSAAARLYGDFAIAEWDERSRRLTLARDALGVRPIYYVVQPGLILFATTLPILLAMPETPRDLDDVTIAHTMTIAMQEQEQTIYRHIRRVPPGGFAIMEDGQCRTGRYFTLDRLTPVRFGREDDYVEAGRDLLDRAVACRLSGCEGNAASLSGGFDSAGVAATAARLLGNDRLRAFTRGAGAAHPYDAFDEVGLAGLVPARYPNIDWTIVDDARESQRDVEPEIEAGALCVPRQGSFNGAWFESLQMAVEASGVGVLLDGGEGNSVLSWGGAPDFARRLRSFQWRGALGDLKGLARERSTTLSRTALSVAANAVPSRAVRRLIYQAQTGSGTLPWLSYSLVSPAFLDEIDYGRHSLNAGHDIPFKPPLDSRELRLRILQRQRGHDFAAYVRKRWTVTRRDPYQDRAMVEFALAIPEDQYWKDGVSRRLARRVLADRVPAEILAQRGKGKQSPEWYFVATRRREAMIEAVERLSRSRLASRVLDIPRMRRLLEQWPEDAERARAHEMLHGHGLHRAIAMGGFLRWYEGGNE